MVYILLITFGSLLFIAIIIMAVGDAMIKKNIRQELAKYNYVLISIKDTDRDFELSELPPVPSWKKHVFVGHTSLATLARKFDYMEVCFIASEKIRVKSLVAISFSFFTSKVYFQIDLNNLQNVSPV